jgi:Fe-S cluster biogenesis protein NfuA
MAKKLFQFRFVKSVFIGRNFVTVTKEEEFKWEELIPVVKDAIRIFIESGQAVVDKVSTGGSTASEDDTEVVRKIKQLIDENVRPAVAMDGGDIIFEGFEEGIVKLKMQGSCQGCPSSTATLKAGIQGLLTRMVPEVKEVQAI